MIENIDQSVIMSLWGQMTLGAWPIGTQGERLTQFTERNIKHYYMLNIKGVGFMLLEDFFEVFFFQI